MIILTRIIHSISYWTKQAIDNSYWNWKIYKYCHSTLCDVDSFGHVVQNMASIRFVPRSQETWNRLKCITT